MLPFNGEIKIMWIRRSRAHSSVTLLMLLLLLFYLCPCFYRFPRAQNKTKENV